MTGVMRYLPGAIPAAAALFDRLDAEIEWLDRMRARGTASFGKPYEYSGQRYPERPFAPSIEAVALHVRAAAGHDFDNCLANLYASGENAMGFHYDSYASLDPESFVAIASFGAARRLVFRGRTTDETRSFVLEAGSIFLMDRETQDHWQHAVPAERGAGRRISLTFRKFA
jgi:alkylated DNA repair dioxygenase AlkB